MPRGGNEAAATLRAESGPDRRARFGIGAHARRASARVSMVPARVPSESQRSNSLVFALHELAEAGDHAYLAAGDGRVDAGGNDRVIQHGAASSRLSRAWPRKPARRTPRRSLVQRSPRWRAIEPRRVNGVAAWELADRNFARGAPSVAPRAIAIRRRSAAASMRRTFSPRASIRQPQRFR